MGQFIISFSLSKYILSKRAATQIYTMSSSGSTITWQQS